MLAAIVTLTLAAGAGTARAGTYVISNCPAAGNPNAGSWTVFGSPQADSATCGGGPSAWIGPLGGSMGPNTSAGVTISTPAGSGITIEQAKVWWSVPSSISGATTFAAATTNNGAIFQSATPMNHSSTPDTLTLPSTSTWLTLMDYCSSDDYSNGCTFGGGENAILQLFGAQLTLNDPNPPTGSVTGGGLAGTGPLSGVQSLAYDASDENSGVQAVQLLVDGQPVATNNYADQCPYEDFLACPANVSDSITWNTASIPNGSHQVALQVINAAQVPAIVDDHTVTIANPAHIPNGSPACEGAQLQLAIAGRAARATVRYGRRPTITGKLECAGVPVIAAAVAIGGGGLNASLTTSALGTFSYRVPVGPSRTITFSYRAFADDSAPSAIARARIAVRPKIELAISPRHTFNGGTIDWGGCVRGGPYPPGGVTLLIEVREGDRWQPFDQIVAPAGRFRYRYTFLRTTEPTTYEFRVALPANGAGGYDYDPGASNTVAVHVR